MNQEDGILIMKGRRTDMSNILNLIGKIIFTLLSICFGIFIWYVLIWFIAYSNLPFSNIGENIIRFGWFAKLILVIVFVSAFTDGD